MLRNQGSKNNQKTDRKNILDYFDLNKYLSALHSNTLTTLDLSEDRLIDYKIAKINNTLKSHTAPVHVLIALSDGRLASGSADKDICIWNGRTGQCETTLSGHTKKVTALAVLPDRSLASGSDDKSIRLWNVETGQCETTLEGHTQEVTALVVLLDGRLASGFDDFSIRLWDVKTRKFDIFKHYASSCFKIIGPILVLLPDGRLASGSEYSGYGKHFFSISIWNVITGLCEVNLDGHKYHLTALAVLPEGRLAAATSGSKDAGIFIWDVRKGECEAIIENGRSADSFTNIALTVLPDGCLVSGSFSKIINLWDEKTWKLKACLIDYQRNGDGVLALTVLPDLRLVSSGYNHNIYLWDPFQNLTLTQILPLLIALTSNTSITSINLQNCHLTDEAIPSLIKYLQPNQSIKDLDVRVTQITTAGFFQLSEAFKSHVSLKTITHEITDTIKSCFEIIQTNSSSQLDFSMQKFEARFVWLIMEPIFIELQKSHSIYTLNLQNLPLTDEDVPKLIRLLLPNQSLKRLDIRNTKITKLGVLELYTAFQQHASLKVIDHEQIDAVIAQQKQQEPVSSSTMLLIVDQMKSMQEMIKILLQQYFLIAEKNASHNSTKIILDALLYKIGGQQEQLDKILQQQQVNEQKATAQRQAIQQTTFELQSQANRHTQLTLHIAREATKERNDLQRDVQAVRAATTSAVTDRDEQKDIPAATAGAAPLPNPNSLFAGSASVVSLASSVKTPVYKLQGGFVA